MRAPAASASFGMISGTGLASANTTGPGTINFSISVFIGVSAGGVLKPEMLKLMVPGPVVFALANPVPEIMPKEALAAGARIVATGRSDFPNQINNSLVFPGIFRGALDVRATTITYEMEQAAAQALADV